MPLTRFAAAALAPVQAADLIPPPRFREKSFSGFRIDPAIPGQAAAVAQVERFATERQGMLSRLFAARRKPGIYLDGGFGVGKTHLLAAAFNAAPGTRRFLSFAEAMSLFTINGKDAALAVLAADLVCIDEFELDDPTNTRIADLLVTALMDGGARILTTSNTVPGELGQGRMAVDLFRTQLARIEAAFAGVHVPGADYRLRRVEAGQPPAQWGPHTEPLVGDGCVVVDVAHLDRWLQNIPVINLRRVAAVLKGLTVTDLRPFENQLAALRFVHLVDKLYDYGVALRVRSTSAIADLFPSEHCLASFSKKYRRCQSRVTELCA